MGQFYQGVWKVQNLKKYIGTKQPTYRSSWEATLMSHFEKNPNVLRWGSEIVKVPYTLPWESGKSHQYVVDFYVEVMNKFGKKECLLIEVKPKNQGAVDSTSKPPTPPKRKTAKSVANYNEKMRVYQTNNIKWEMAKRLCLQKGWKWMVMTEDHLIL